MGSLLIQSSPFREENLPDSPESLKSPAISQATLDVTDLANQCPIPTSLSQGSSLEGTMEDRLKFHIGLCRNPADRCALRESQKTAYNTNNIAQSFWLCSHGPTWSPTRVSGTHERSVLFTAEFTIDQLFEGLTTSSSQQITSPESNSSCTN